MQNDLDDPFNAPPPPPAVKPTIDDVLASLKFSVPTETQTKKGPRMRSSASLKAGTTLDILQDNSQVLWGRGYSLQEWPAGTGKWSLTKWEMVPEKIVVQRQEDWLTSDTSAPASPSATNAQPCSSETRWASARQSRPSA